MVAIGLVASVNTHTVELQPAPHPGDTVLVERRQPAMVIEVAQKLSYVPATCVVAEDPPCSGCASPLQFDEKSGGWRCDGCSSTYTGDKELERIATAALAEVTS